MPKKQDKKTDIALLTRLYRSVRLIRRVEEVIADIYPSDKIKSPVHLAIGQEHVAVAACDSLGEGDWVAGSYRSHAMYLAKGGDLRAMIAEMYGKDTGCCRGKGGSMHVIDTRAGVMGSSAVVATQIPIAAGAALAQKRAKQGKVTVVFFGDGACEEGSFYETLNFAALHKLPILFVCENNGYAIHEPIQKRRARPDGICAVVEALGIPTVRIEDGNTLAIHAEAADAIKSMRGGGGPRMIEAMVYRWREHVGPNEDYDDDYRNRTEAAPWMASDQVAHLGEMLEPSARSRIDEEIERQIADAVRFAEESPAPNPKELYAGVYA